MSNACDIVMTGAGLVTSLGLDRESTWRSVLQGKCGIAPLTAIESPLDPDKGGGQAPDLPQTDEGLREPAYLRRAIAEALVHAGITGGLPYRPERCGLLIGTTLHGMRSGGRFFRTKELSHFGSFLASSVLRDAAREFGLRGPATTVCAACSSGLSSVALAVTLLRTGYLDLVLAGGYDTISEYAYGGFNSMRLMAEGDATPFSMKRDGLKLGEGYGVIVMERAYSARQRCPEPEFLALLAGTGESCDAFHLSKPEPEGRGAATAMGAALEAAGVSPDAIDMVAAHGTATPDNDAAEFAAMRSVFGESIKSRPVVAFKSHLGHTLGGAGAVELILSAMALRDCTVPPCANTDVGDLEFTDLRLSVEAFRPSRLDHTLNTSLGFGGANTCVVLRKRNSAARDTGVDHQPIGFDDTGNRAVLVTGVGVITPHSISNQEFTALLDGDRGLTESDTGDVPAERIAELVSARRVRRMSTYSKLTLAATTLAYRDAGIDDAADFGEGCSAILGTMHGATAYSERYYQQIVEEGIDAANPILFAEGVPNAAAAHLGTVLSVKGLCQTVIGSRTAGVDALILAAHRIASGEWDRAIVSAAEEYSTLVNQAYERFGLYRGASRGNSECRHPGFVTGAGAVTFILESRAAAEQRGCPQPHGYGHIQATAGASCPAPASGAGIAAMVGVLDGIGRPTCVMTSANGTWIDRIESRALGRLAGTTIGSLRGRIAESFSVTPLAAIAAVLLTRSMPCRHAAGERPDSFGAIATDYSGAMAGIGFGLPAGVAG